MTQNFKSSKPEWFKLVDSDAPSAQVRKVDKKFPAIAAVVAGAIIAAGGLFANASGENQIVSNSAIATAAPVAPNQGGIQAPSKGGMSAPTGDDDDDDDDEREGHGDRDRH
jgi:hypothetical protein